MKSIFLKVDKKYRFLIHASVYAVILYSYSTGLIYFNSLTLLVLLFLTTVLSVFFAHFPNINIRNILIASLLPVNLALGGTLVLVFYPNVNILFKVAVIFGLAFLDYIILLIDNIFLVVSDREELIPLYRVAVTWSLVIQILVFIPLSASVLKLNFNGVVQAVLIGLDAFLFCVYQIWITRYDRDAKNVSWVEGLFLTLFVYFIVGASVIGVSFIPAEPFLKALLTSTIAMFTIGYVSGYLKNEISKKYIVQYSFIIIFFLLLTIIFRF